MQCGCCGGARATGSMALGARLPTQGRHRAVFAELFQSTIVTVEFRKLLTSLPQPVAFEHPSALNDGACSGYGMSVQL